MVIEIVFETNFRTQGIYKSFTFKRRVYVIQVLRLIKEEWYILALSWLFFSGFLTKLICGFKPKKKRRTFLEFNFNVWYVRMLMLFYKSNQIQCWLAFSNSLSISSSIHQSLFIYKYVSHIWKKFTSILENFKFKDQFSNFRS